MSQTVDGYYENIISVFMKDTSDYENITVNFTLTETLEEKYTSEDKSIREMDEETFEREMRHRRTWVAENIRKLLRDDLINHIMSERITDTDHLEELLDKEKINPTAAYR